MLIPLLPLGFMGLGPMELIIFGVVAVLLFGSRLPSVARSAGKSLTEFKKGMQDLQDDVRDSIEVKEPAGTTAHPSSVSKTSSVTQTNSGPEDEESYDGYPEPEAPRFESSSVEVPDAPAADKSST